MLLIYGANESAANGGKWSFAKATSVKWVKPKRAAPLLEIYDAESVVRQ